MKQTPIGERRHRIEIQEHIMGENEWGQPIDTWQPFAAVWAAKLSHSGRKFFQAQQIHSEVTEVFNIRYLPGITTQMRVVSDGRTYQLLDVDDPEGRHAEINLVCKGLV